MSDVEVALMLRATAAVVWTGVLIMIVSGKWVTTPLRRTIVTASFVVLLWALVYGGAVPLGIVPREFAPTLYTAVAVGCIISGVTLLLTAGEPDERVE